MQRGSFSTHLYFCTFFGPNLKFQAPKSPWDFLPSEKGLLSPSLLSFSSPQIDPGDDILSMEIMYRLEPSTLETSLLGNENQDPLLSGRVPGIL